MNLIVQVKPWPSWACFTAKIYLVMRISAVLLLACCLQVSAATQAQKVTLSMKQAPLQKVFTEIIRQTGVSIVYNETVIAAMKPITVQVQDMPLQDVLAECLKGQALEFKIEDNNVIIHSRSNITALLEKMMLRGVVTDSALRPIPGVSIRIKGTTISTVSGADGSFELKGVDVGAVIEISSIGFETQRITVRSDNRLSVILRTSITALSETNVVSTGYQQISRERTAGSFSKPDEAVYKNRSGSMNIIQRIEGLVPGLTINNAPNSVSGNSILIRGLSSISGSTSHGPLIVVDGIPLNNIGSINPQDVADITVLKDATAASIWGSRASNGVIVIVTKKGLNSSRIKMEYDGFNSFQGKPELSNIPVLNSRQFIDAATEVFTPTLAANAWGVVSSYTNNAGVAVPPHERILYNQYRGLITAAQAKAQLDSLAGINNQSQIRDLWYRNAALTNHTLSIRGGTEKYGFYGSAAYTGLKSTSPGEKNNSFKLNLRQDYQFNQHFSIFLITDLTNTLTRSARNIGVDYRMLPYQLFRDAQGNNLSMPHMLRISDSLLTSSEARSKISLDYNPLNERDYGKTESNALFTRITGGLSLKLFKGLRFEGVYGYIKGTNRTTSFDSEQSYMVRNELVQFTVAPTAASVPVYYLPATGGRYSVNNSVQTDWTVRNQLIFDHDWKGRRHQLTMLAGQEAQEQSNTFNSSMVRGYNDLLQSSSPIDYLMLTSTGIASPVIANGTNRSILGNTGLLTESAGKFRATSYYANAAYTFLRKYALNASWRIDESNLFGRDKSAQNKPVWSIGGKWTATQENFLQPVKWLDLLALRLTYGITGNSPSPGTAASFDILSASSSSFMLGGQGLNLSVPANARLTWERTQTTNLGLDFTLLQHRLRGTVDIYLRKTNDLIANLELNPFSGYSAITGNLGDMENKGIELGLQSLNISKGLFSWTTSFTLAYNKNKITRLNLFNPINTGEQKITQRYLPGYAALPLFAYDYAGLDNLGDPQIYVDGKINKKRGMAKPEDIRYMGTVQPLWSGGLSNNFSYGNFSLSANLIYNLGHVMRRDVNGAYSGGRLVQGGGDNAFNAGNPHQEFASRWKKPGDEAFTDIPAYIVNPTIGFSQRNTDFYTLSNTNVLKASYVKLRDITLFYSLPKTLLTRIKTENITLRCQLSNVMLWKANKYNIDPEFMNAFGGSTSGGIRSVPFGQKSVSLGAHVAF